MCFFFFIVRRPSSSTLLPYTTLFRSEKVAHDTRAAFRRVGDLLRPCHDGPCGVQLAEQRGLAHHHGQGVVQLVGQDRKSTRLNSSHLVISYAVFCLKKKQIIVIQYFY